MPKSKSPSQLKVRDASGRWILATAIPGDAEVLVTGDSDLLAIARKAPPPIVDARSFWGMLRESAI